MATVSEPKVEGVSISNPASILVIEDDPSLNQQVAELLSDAGYLVSKSYDGEEGLSCAIKGRHNLVILDVMLPKRDGFSLLNLLRKSSAIPVIMLTAKGAEEERIRGFQQGADDYLAKPFNTTELLLRIEALLRRCNPESFGRPPQVVRLDSLVVDLANNQFHVDTVRLELTPIEYKLLQTLISSPGEILSKPFLYQTVLHRAYSAYDRSLDMHLSRVRRKLNNSGWDGARLQTVHGKGYLLA